MHTNHSNKEWYSFRELGFYFRLEQGKLIACNMLLDGKRSDYPFPITLDVCHVPLKEKLQLTIDVLSTKE
jgi:hypothetical protein